MDTTQKVAVVGGDMRYFFAAQKLADRGLDVFTVGFGDDMYTASEAVRHADFVLFPITQKGDAISTLDGQKLSAANIVAAAEKAAFLGGYGIFETAAGRRCFDITQNERFLRANAELTAEGALGIMINSVPVSVGEADVAILGYGRIGRALAKMLCALGASVTVFARREDSRSEAKNICTALDYPDFEGGYDVIVNTVPARTLSNSKLELIKNSYVIELASAPYGFDAAFCENMRKRFIHAPGLPGKTAPASAGHAVANAVLDTIKGEI